MARGLQQFGAIRTFRDPVHLDIQVGPVAAAVIDTPLFQRLRYIRQTGLLHFVFPGAVHTRFSHCVGTMHMARRVFTQLFQEYRIPVAAAPAAPSAAQYVGTVFEVAALLHDLGHCAFSHSLENVRMSDQPFLRPMATIVSDWADEGLSAWWSKVIAEGQYAPPDITEHEQIGLLMMGLLFEGRYERVCDAIRSVLGVEPRVFADDVRAMVIGQLRPSARFRRDASQLVGRYVPRGTRLSAELRAEDLLSALHTLISGTLDVDRMDYLLRDSLHTGTVYGLYDADVLINAITLHAVDGGERTRVELALQKRATGALDDMLWGRYQLFSQVLNHKANVMLNALLAQAIPEAIDEASVTYFGVPRTIDDFVLFTDDRVMSAVTRASLQSGRKGTVYDDALVSRVLPKYLSAVSLTGKPRADTTQVAAERTRLIDQHCARDPSRLREWKTRSDLVKGGGLPHVVRKDKGDNRIEVIAPGSAGAYQVVEWTKSGKLPASVGLHHFFLTRGR